MAEVLLVDDDPDIRAMLVFAFADYGFSVREAGDGQQALTVLQEHAPDIMILDLMMPGLDGFGLLAAMRERNVAPETRVLILSCKVDERDLTRGYELGADDYVTKPFDPDSLVRKVEAMLAAAPRR
jgi:two-component system OmpR family response regulator